MAEFGIVQVVKSVSNSKESKKDSKGQNWSILRSKILLSSSEDAQPMFKSLIPFVKMQLSLCNRLITVPFEWDDRTQRLSLLKSINKLRICKAQIFLHILYTLVMAVYFATPTSRQKNKTSAKMLGVVFLICFITTMLMRITFWKKRKEVVLLINSFLKFEEKYLSKTGPRKGTKPKVDKISKMLMTLGFVTSMGLPGLMCTMIFVDPCKPPHLGYILFKTGLNTCLVPKFHLRISLLIFDTWMWANSIIPACLFAFQIFFLCLKCLHFYLKLIIRGCKQPLGERFGSQEEKDRLAFKLYRHVALMAKVYNGCLKSVFIPTQIIAACLVIIIGLYTCIKLHKNIPMPGFAFFPLLSMDGFSMIFISQVAAGVYLQSTKFVTFVRKNHRYSRKSWTRKMATSCDLIRIQFGSTSFIDQMTPIVYINFCFTQTVSLVLLS